ncbi:hypothetical protein EDB85DRAFT_1896328 [Lactarius pseudohatsudake]|nr:hypothetical protein EDB85DRAFT_1896328 [Lactarius pseudohatsudake]
MAHWIVTGGQWRACANMGKGLRAPHLHANGAAAVNAGEGREFQPNHLLTKQSVATSCNQLEVQLQPKVQLFPVAVAVELQSFSVPATGLSKTKRASVLHPLFDASGVGKGSGAGGEERRGGRCRWRGGRPTLAHPILCSVQSLRMHRQKQNVPAMLAVQNWTNWVCKRRMPTPSPTPPSSPLLSSHSAPLAYPTRVEKWTQCASPFACREGAHGSCPLSTLPYSRETGAHEGEGHAGPSPRSCGPAAAPWSLPSPQHPPSARKEDTSAPSPLSAPPRSRGKGVHEGTSPRPLPVRARRTVRPPQSPSAQVTQPNPTCPTLPIPAPPTDARRGTVRPPHRMGHASPAARTRKGEGRRIHPLRTGYASPAFTHAATPVLPWGCKRVGAPSPAPSVWGVLPSPPRLHAAPEKRVCGRGGAERNPGGGAMHERKGRHIGAWVQKGESDGEGVVNKAKRSWGEAVHTNGGHPPRQ